MGYKVWCNFRECRAGEVRRMHLPGISGSKSALNMRRCIDVIDRLLEVRVPEEFLNDLHALLDSTRWPGEVAGAGREQSTNLACVYLLESMLDVLYPADDLGNRHGTASVLRRGASF